MIVTAEQILRDIEAHGGDVEEPYDLSLAAAARLAGVDASTIHRWATSGRLPAFWVYSRRRFRRSDVLAAMDAS